MGKLIIINVFRFLALVAVQVVLFKNIGYYNLATPYPYILFIFLLPSQISNFSLYLISFIIGITVDSFYDSLGVHAAACVALAWFRIVFNQLTLDYETSQSVDTLTWGEMGAKWYFSYILIGTFIHHLLLNMMEVFSFKNFHLTLLSVLLSTIFTFFTILLISLLFFKRKSRLSR